MLFRGTGEQGGITVISRGNAGNVRKRIQFAPDDHADVIASPNVLYARVYSAMT